MLARDLAPEKPGEAHHGSVDAGFRPVFPDSVTLEGRLEPVDKPCQTYLKAYFINGINGLPPLDEPCSCLAGHAPTGT